MPSTVRVSRGSMMPSSHSARGGEEGVRLLLDLLLDHLPQRRVGRLVERLAGALGGLAAHDGEHAGELLRAHHRDAVVRPGEHEARVVGAAAHAVVAGAVATRRP